MKKAGVAIAVVAGLLIVIGVTVVTTDEAAESAGLDEVGRYQIAQGCYVGILQRGMAEKPRGREDRYGVFKIDTTTGQTWVYEERSDTSSIIEDKYIRQWVPID